MPNEDWGRLAQYVRTRREELGLATRRAFTQATGLSYRLLGDLERGTRSVSDGTLSLVEQALDWRPGSAREILDGGEPTPRDRPAMTDSGIDSSKWMRSMGEAYRIAADLTRSGQIGLSDRLTRALSDISQALMIHTPSPSDSGEMTPPARPSDRPAEMIHPTVLGIALGSLMRQLREQSGFTSARANEALGWPPADVRLFELGHIALDKSKIRQLLKLYGVKDIRIHQECMRAAEEAERSGWWINRDGIVPEWLRSYLQLEQRAQRILTFEAHFIPGLLQTEAYARSVISYQYKHPIKDEFKERFESQLKIRMSRQRALVRRRPHRLPLWAIIDATAISHAPAGKEIMFDQVSHLIEMIIEKRAIIQILRSADRVVSGYSPSFSLLRFEEPELPDIVYTEQLTSALYLDRPQDLDEYKRVFDILSVTAQTPEDSYEHLMGLRKSLHEDIASPIRQESDQLGESCYVLTVDGTH